MHTITAQATAVELSALELSDVDTLIAELEAQFQGTHGLIAEPAGAISACRCGGECPSDFCSGACTGKCHG